LSMAERIVFEAVRDELSVYTDESNAGRKYKSFLINEVGLDDDEAERARVHFSGGTYDGETFEARPPTLTHGYPRSGGPFPQWALTLSAESPVEHFLGDDALPYDEEGNPIEDDDGVPAESKIRRVKYTYSFLVIVDHPDLVLYHYHLLKHLLLRRTRWLVSRDLDDLEISGQDLAPDPRYLPSDVFVRVLSLSVETDECWVEPLSIEDDGGTRATKVAGIHVMDGDEVTLGEGSIRALVKPV